MVVQEIDQHKSGNEADFGDFASYHEGSLNKSQADNAKGFDDFPD
mgnify:CR=1 FL=1